MKVQVELEIEVKPLKISVEGVKRLVKKMVNAQDSDAVQSVKITNVKLG